MFINNKIPRSTPEQQGVSSGGILSFLDAVEENKLNLNGLMIIRHDHVVAEGWWAPYDADIPHLEFSVTKSFASTATGFAVQEKLLSVDDLVLSFFPEKVTKEIEENMGELKVKHLLMMGTGHTRDTFMHSPERYSFLTDRGGPTIGSQAEDWVKGFIDMPLEKEPGTHYVYNTGASHMLAEIIYKLTGQTLVEYLKPRLFDPLGIVEHIWETSPQGLSCGGYGLRLKTEDIARFGLLHLHKGVWNGQRIISEDWVEEATSKQIDTGFHPESLPDWRQGYGYQFWRTQYGGYRADGSFGQLSIVLPDLNVVVAINSGVLQSDVQRILDLVWEHLLPVMKPDVLHEEVQTQALLKQKLDSLTITPLSSAAADSLDLSHRRYELEPNEDQLVALSFTFTEKECKLTFHDNSGEYQLECGIGTWVKAGNQLAGEPIAATCRWVDKNKLVLVICRVQTPFYCQLDCRFEGERLVMSYNHFDYLRNQKTYSLQGRLVPKQ